MGLEDEDFTQSDDDFDDKKHEKLVDTILTLDKPHHLKGASRTEPALQISEFDLVNSITGKKGLIRLGDLTNSLQNKKIQAAIKNKVVNTSKVSSTLAKPLEKPIANQIARTVGYEKTRLELDRWEPIITANRVSTNLVFPLPTIDKDKKGDFAKKWTAKTSFDIEVEKTNPQLIEEIHVEDTEQEKVKLTLKELREKRAEVAKMRAKLSYQEAKAKRQSKIKSKKYHRHQKRRKIKQHLLDFEELKKTNPAAALKKLQDIEKIRAEERFSLRHKSTGKWAKHKQIHAKYDKESRAELAEQLKLSKELTQKINQSSDESEEEAEDNNANKILLWNDENLKADSEVSNFVSKNIEFLKDRAAVIDDDENEEFKTSEELDKKIIPDENDQNEGVTHSEKSHDIVPPTDKISKPNKSDKVHELKKRQTVTQKALQKNLVEVDSQKLGTENKKKSRKRKRSALNVSSTSDWDVELVNNNIDVIFDELEKKMEQKMTKEAKKIENQVAPKKSNKKQKNNLIVEEKESLLALPIEKKRPVIDEPLLETAQNETPEGELNNLSNILKHKNLNIDKTMSIQKKTITNNNSKKPKKVIELDNMMPDIVTNMDEDDDEEDPTQQELKEEAADCFQNDLAEQFAKEKSEAIEKDKPKDVDLYLPGWGSWGGIGIKPNKRKKRRFIVQAPKVVPRRDDNKGFLIINEEANKSVKAHMVDELPFPFTSVKDFEASIRAPIGRSFVPETAFNKLIKPAVTTKMGTIIEPMDKDVLLNKSSS